MEPVKNSHCYTPCPFSLSSRKVWAGDERFENPIILKQNNDSTEQQCRMAWLKPRLKEIHCFEFQTKIVNIFASKMKGNSSLESRLSSNIKEIEKNNGKHQK